ncbi:hypothetical protein JY97_01535 [Alkalispirochaeta odontotermitis]|nr:hypothetical protein JY97_01535 [Alkalispirochaeta odontotermitis]CAB1080578.1 hypothetical protein D1AOALGA4SA_8258 [Olavius algarvensis Delta 1 endosymbiont]
MPQSHYKEQLFELLPRLYHTYDQNHGVLKAFLAAVGDTLDDMEHNIAGLYDDSFIETCREWVVPYIGQLIGARLIENDGNRNRQEVMKTIGWRRSKGTLGTLEDVAREITGWGGSGRGIFRTDGVEPEFEPHQARPPANPRLERPPDPVRTGRRPQFPAAQRRHPPPRPTPGMVSNQEYRLFPVHRGAIPLPTGSLAPGAAPPLPFRPGCPAPSIDAF